MLVINQQASSGGIFPSDELLDTYLTKAEVKLNHYTFGRIKKLDMFDQRLVDIYDAIEAAKLAIAEHMYRYEQSGGTVVSERIGDQSVSYQQTVRTIEDEYYRIATEYLSGTDLMYRGWGD
ncbi:MAG: hypothetical protein ACRC6H_05745 [Culicoidibacterales bacterium]